MTNPDPPLAVLAELTHRCPLQCPYCSNPLELERASGELDTAAWTRVMDQAAAMGVLQIHFSGGEPTVRKDLEDLVGHAAALGLYSNLITAGVLLDEARIERLSEAGLDHVQLSIQDSDAVNADHIGGFAGGFTRKIQAAHWIRAAGLPLTVNAPVHRSNLAHLEDIIALAVELGAEVGADGFGHTTGARCQRQRRQEGPQHIRAPGGGRGRKERSGGWRCWERRRWAVWAIYRSGATNVTRPPRRAALF